MTRNQIKQIRKTLRYSLQKFAELTGYTKTYIHMVEKGTEPVTMNLETRVFEGLKSHIIELEKLVQRIIRNTK